MVEVINVALTIDKFIADKYKLYVRYNKTTSGYQCVDLAKAWLVEGTARIYEKHPNLKTVWAWGNAKDWLTNAPKNAPDVLEVGRDKAPRMGDLVVFGKCGQYGHIAIAMGIQDDTGILTFDQNYPTNSKCTCQWHKWDTYTGYLRLK